MTQNPDAETEKKGSLATGPENAEALGVQESMERIAAELEAAKGEAASNYDRYTRAVADLENFRKRTLRDKEELRQFAAASLIEDVIPIMDNLSLGLAAARQQSEGSAIVEGMAMVLDQFKTALAKHGLTEIDPAGQPFDPNRHECISQLPSEEVAAESVLQVVRRGYSLNGRLIRPASVVVSGGPAKPANGKN